MICLYRMVIRFSLLQIICCDLFCRLNYNELKLVVKIRSYWSLPDGGPKTYIWREFLTKIVDRHSFSLLQLVDYIGEHFVWGSKQYITLWRSLEDAFIEIQSDEQLLEWFELN